MSKIRNSLSIAMVMAFLSTSLSAAEITTNGWTYKIKNRAEFTKDTQDRADYDTNHFEGTGITTGWREQKNGVWYVLDNEIIWTDLNNTRLYVSFKGNYGWLLRGKEIVYPNTWHLTGTKWAASGTFGGIVGVNDCFYFTPHFGFQYIGAVTKLHDQHRAHPTPSTFISRNGTHSKTTQFLPYIGFGMNYNLSHVDIGMGYDFYYVYGHSKTHVKNTVITDDYNTFLYGSHYKIRDMFSHAFSVAFGYSFAQHWRFAFDAQYAFQYNTSNLPVHLDNNSQIVEEGQFTPTQYHEITSSILRDYYMALTLGYTF